MRASLNLSLRTKVLGVILLAVVPLGVSIAVFSVTARQDERADEGVGREREFRLALEALMNAVVDAQTGARGFLLTKNERFLEPYEAARAVLPERLDELERMAGPADRNELTVIRATVTDELAALSVLIDGRGDNPVSRFVAEKANVDKLRTITARLREETDADIAAILARRDRARSRTYRTLMIGGSVGGLASVVAAFVLAGNFVRRVRRNTENARALAEGGDLHPAENGSDELAELSRRLHETALLLRARESTLRQARVEADSANRAKSEFLSRMSHELRTPLNAVIGFAQVLDQDVSPAQREDVEEILRAGKHLLSLIDEVLDLSRIETGMLKMSVEPVAVADVITESIALVRGSAAARSIGMRVGDIDEELHVLADKQRLKQVVVNLLSNAIKYNRDHGTVYVQITPSEESVRIAVIDEGSGISTRLQRDLFTPFSRLGAEETSIEGTGLGLALSKHLVEAMGGDIQLRSEVGVGSTFWVDLARTTASARPVPSRAVERGEDLEATPHSGNGLSILQFEDNPSNVRLIQRALRSRPGVALQTAMTGAQGFEILQTQPRPDLIFLDVNLPDTSGMDVLIRLRANPPTREIPVVVLSADATEAQIEQMLSLGAERYLTKPIDIDELHDLLDEAVARAAKLGGADG